MAERKKQQSPKGCESRRPAPGSSWVCSLAILHANGVRAYQRPREASLHRHSPPRKGGGGDRGIRDGDLRPYSCARAW
jgi:hypothetical protein